MLARENFETPHVWHNRSTLLQDAQNVRPAGPQESKHEAYPLRYVEDFDEPRTLLAGCFSILLQVDGPVLCGRQCLGL